MNSSAIRSATEHIHACADSIKNGKLNDAKLKCIQGLALANFASDNTENIPIADIKILLNGCRCVLEAVHENCLQNDVISGNEPIQQEKHEFQKQLSVTFTTVIGCADAKRALYENVVLPLQIMKTGSQIFRGIRGASGNVLLHGPPGTGKTLIAQATAGEAQATFLTIHPSDVLSKYQGESERYLKSIFSEARKHERAIIFFDEFDSISCARMGAEEGSQSRRLLAELLMQLSSNKQLQTRDPGSSSVVIIAATNRIEDIDEAVLRRFERKIYVGVPDQEARENMLKKHLHEIRTALSPEDITNIAAELTVGWSGCDIEVLCREACMVPVREVLHYPGVGGLPDGEGAKSISIKTSPGNVSPLPAQYITSKFVSCGSTTKRQRVDIPREPPSLSSLEDINVRPVCLNDFDSARTTLLASNSSIVEVEYNR